MAGLSRALARVPAVVGVAVLGAVVPAEVAHAQTDGREITRYDARVDVAADGVADVRVELDLDFGDEPGHGPFLTLPTRQEIAGDDRFDRLYDITDVTASSATAPDALDVETTDEGLVLRIGDEDVDDVDGVHTYVVTYRVDGWVNPAGVPDPGTGEPAQGDELYLDVLGPAWEVPLSDVSARVTGPAPVDDVACFAGPRGSADPCTEASDGGGTTASFRQDAVAAGEPFTVVVRWPAGTFPDVTPILGEKLDPSAPVRPTALTALASLLIAGVGGTVAVRRVRREGRDRSAIGLPPPGMLAGGDRLAGTFRDHRPPVAVRSTPPDGVLPGELGTLLDEVADPRDVTATIVDLAVRGHLHISELPPEDPQSPTDDWELVVADDAPGDLVAYERRLLDELFRGRDSVRMSELRRTFSGAMGDVQQLLYQHVTERGWFAGNPGSVRRRWYVTGALLLVTAVVVLAVGFGALIDGLALVAGALGIVGLLVLVLAHAAPARTPTGTEVLAEAAAFKRYLETADADRLRAVHGEDTFSHYLPYAIVFGLAERWAGAFSDLADEGVLVPEPTWYRGSSAAPYIYWGAGAGFGHSVDSFASIATDSISASTPASSGSSGMTGGFSGGGVGGGGGGGW